jgi:hypothetical protein
MATVVPSITTGPEPRSNIQPEHLTGALFETSRPGHVVQMKIPDRERGAVGKLSDHLALGCVMVGMLIALYAVYGFLK